MNSTNNTESVESAFIFVQDDDEVIKIVDKAALTQAALITFSCILSMLGSVTIMLQILRNSLNRKTLQQQIVLCISIFDIVAALFAIFSDYMAPKGLLRYYLIDESFFLIPSKSARGNNVTYYINIFLVQLSLCAVLYNVFLATYYLLVTKYKWSEGRIRKSVPYVHTAVLVIGFSNAILGLTSDCYEFPVTASKWYFVNDPTIKSSRMYYCVLWTSIVIITVQQVQMFRYVQQTARAMDQYRSNQTSGMRSERSDMETRVLCQSLLYVGSFYLTWVIPTACVLVFRYYKSFPFKEELMYLAFFIYPLQGFFNTIAFFRPRFLKLKGENPEAKRRVLVWKLLESSLIFRFDSFFTTDNKDIFD